MLKTIVAAICLALPIVIAVSESHQRVPIEFLAANNTNTTNKNCNATLSTYQWVYSNVYSQLPRDAVAGGFDKNKNAIYVGRAYHNGVNWPASIVPAKRAAYITVSGKSVNKETFEVLVGNNFSWEMGYDGNVPNGAMSTSTGYWIGRALYKNGLIVGKVSRKHKACQVSYDNKEKNINKYEVLVYHGPYKCSCKF